MFIKFNPPSGKGVRLNRLWLSMAEYRDIAGQKATFHVSNIVRDWHVPLEVDEYEAFGNGVSLRGAGYGGPAITKEGMIGPAAPTGADDIFAFIKET